MNDAFVFGTMAGQEQERFCIVPKDRDKIFLSKCFWILFRTIYDRSMKCTV